MAMRAADSKVTTEESAAATLGRATRDCDLVQRVLDAIPQPLLVIDVDSCQVVMCNAAASAGRATGAITCHLLSHGRVSRCDDSPDAPCPLEQVKREQRPVTVEHIHYDRRGQPNYVEVSAFPVFDAAGAVRHVVELSRVVTPRRRAERERERLIEQLRDALRAGKPAARLVPICA
jgi:PAS domain-containing protein